jgi:protocatechuate 3,4-dioxygenase beta subunit
MGIAHTPRVRSTTSLTRHLVASLIALTLVGGAAGAVEPPSVHGTVLDSEGNAIVGARVALFEVDSPHAVAARVLDGGPLLAPSAAEAETGEDGRFVLDAPAAGFWRVRVEAEGFAPAEQTITPLLESTWLDELRLDRASDVVVRVADDEGAPVAGALVAVLADVTPNTWGPARHAGRTDAKGELVAPASATARLGVSVVAPGYVPADDGVRAGAARRVTLERGAERAIEIVDAGGAPASDAIVLDAARGLALARADEQGFATVRVPATGELPIDVVTANGASTSLRASPAPFDDAPPLLALIEPRVTATGRVTAEDDGRPVVGALVWRRGAPADRATTDDAGRFTISGPLEGESVLVAAAPGYVPSLEGEVVLAEGRSIALSMQPAASVRGRVVDADGAPVAGARVHYARVFDARFSPRRRFVRGAGDGRARFFGTQRHGETNAEGRFALSGIAPERDGEVLATAEGFAPSRVPVDGLEPGAVAKDLEIVLTPGATIAGRVVDAEGEPIEGVIVGASEHSRMPRFALFAQRIEDSGRMTRTDAAGRFALEHVPDGEFDVRFERRGFAPAVRRAVAVKDGAGTELGDVELPPGVPIRGTVVDAEGAPVSDVEVYVLGGAMPGLARMRRVPTWAGLEPSATSSADGAFLVEDRARGERVSILAQAKGYALGRAIGVEVPSPEPLRIELTPASRVSGVVLDADDRPIVGASVRLSSPQVGGGGRRMRFGRGGAAETDSEGRFVIEDVVPGRWVISADATGYLDAVRPPFEVPRGEDVEDVRIVLERGATITGVVTSPTGESLGDVRISVTYPTERDTESTSGDSARTDAEGRYVLRGVSTGQASVVARHAEYPETTRDLTVESGDNTLDVTMDPGLTLRGRVVADDGAPIADARVFVTPAGGGWRGADARSEADGSFLVEGLAPGDYEATASAEGYAPLEEAAPRVSLARDALPEPVEIVLGPTATITGAVLGLSEDRLADVQVRARASGGGWAAGSVDYNGSFRIEDVGPGTWTITGSTAEGSRQAQAEVTIEPGRRSATVDLDFGAGSTLSGVVSIAGEPLAGAQVVARNETTMSFARAVTGSDGRYALEGLADGRYELIATDPEATSSVEREVDLTGDQVVDLELPTARVSGFVRRVEDRSPLANVAVTIEPRGGSTAVGRGAFWLTRQRSDTTDEQGRFSVDGVAEGQWIVRARRDGYAVGEASVALDGRTGVDDVQIELTPTEGLMLQVFGPQGQPVGSASVAVLDSAGQAVAGRRVQADSKGFVFLPSVPSGTWEVVVGASGAATTSVPATAPGAATAVSLPRACKLVVTVDELRASATPATLSLRDATGRLHRAVMWTGEVRAEWPLRQGQAEIEALAPGTWTATVTAADGRAWQKVVTLSPGVAQRVALD